MKASDWIDRVKKSKGLPSDYAAAKLLGFKPNTISTYRKTGAPMDENIAMKIAHALEIDPAIILADQAMERAKNTEAKSAWSNILEKLGGVMVSVMLTAGLGAGLTVSPDAQAGSRYPINSNSDLNLYTSYQLLCLGTCKSMAF